MWRRSFLRISWRVYDFSIEELRQLDLGAGLSKKTLLIRSLRSKFCLQIGLNFVVPIPTLGEALEFTNSNHWWVNIEIKMPAAHLLMR